jgi:ERCC4-type nuclease
MVKHWTETDLVAALSDLKIIADSREQVNNHITEYWDRKKVPYFTRKLDVGDYSAQLGDYTLEHDIAVERKHNIDEICGNLTQDRDRFEREFLRAKAIGCKVFLIIENASWNDVLCHNYSSLMDSKSLFASLCAWQARFNVTIVFADKANMASILYGILYYYCRKELIGDY